MSRVVEGFVMIQDHEGEERVRNRLISPYFVSFSGRKEGFLHSRSIGMLEERMGVRSVVRVGEINGF